MNRTLGLMFMVAGVAGVVISLLFIPAVWIGRIAAVGYVADATDQGSSALQQVQETTAQFRGDIDTLRGPLEQVAGQADSVAAAGPVEQQVSARLLGIIDQTIGPAYVRLRDAYLSLRDKVAGAMQAVAVVQRLVPGLSLPAVPTDELATLDSQLQAMDASIQEAHADLAAGSLPDAVPGIGTMRRVGEGMRTVDARLNTLGTTADNITARAQALQVALQDARATFERTMNILAVVLTILCVDLTALNAGLFAYGRELRRRSLPTRMDVATSPYAQQAVTAGKEPSGVAT
jgi:hypothetical protein